MEPAKENLTRVPRRGGYQDRGRCGPDDDGSLAGDNLTFHVPSVNLAAIIAFLHPVALATDLPVRRAARIRPAEPLRFR